MSTSTKSFMLFITIFLFILHIALSKPFSRFNFAEIERELENFQNSPFEAEQALGDEDISEKDLELLGLIGKELKEMRRSLPEHFFNPNPPQPQVAAASGQHPNM